MPVRETEVREPCEWSMRMSYTNIPSDGRHSDMHREQKTYQIGFSWRSHDVVY